MTAYPSTKRALIEWTRSHPSLPAGVTVGGGVPDLLAATLPLVAIYRPPGPPPSAGRLDRMLANVQTWAGSEHEAEQTALAVLDIVRACPGHTTTTPPVVFARVRIVTGLGQLHDPGHPDLYRYIFTAEVSARVA